MVPKLLLSDKAAYRNFLRMDSESFMLLLDKVTPMILRQDTHLRDSITPAERLAATLRFLATGGHFK